MLDEAKYSTILITALVSMVFTPYAIRSAPGFYHRLHRSGLIKPQSEEPKEETGLTLDMFATGNYNSQDVYKIYDFMNNYKNNIIEESPEIWSVFMKFVNMAS